MPPLTLLGVEPASQLQFPLNGGSLACARLRLTNVAGTLVAYKVKSTAPKNYVIKPSTGSIRRGQVAEVQIARKAPDEESPGHGTGGSKRPDRFLVQAAIVENDEQKLLLHAAQRGKTAGAAKFWEGVPKDSLEEQQLVALLVEGNAGAQGGPSAGGPSADPGEGRARAARPVKQAGNYSRDGMPSNEDVDAIIGKLSLPGRSQPSVPADPGGRGPPGLGGPPGLADDALDGADAEDADLYRYEAAAHAAFQGAGWKKPQVKRREDIVLQKHSRPVTFVRIDPSGKMLFTCGKDKLVIAWSIPEGEILRWFEGHRGAVWACSVDATGKLLLTCGADSLVILWDVDSARQLGEVQMPGVVRCVEWAPLDASFGADQRRFLACSNSFKARPAALALLALGGKPSPEDGTAAIQTRLTVEEPALPSGAVQVAWAGPGGAHLCSVHATGELLFWHEGTGQMLVRLDAHEGPVSQVAFPRDRSLMATCGRVDMQVKIWDLSAMGTPLGLATLLRSFQSDRPLNAVTLRPSLSREEVESATVDARRCDCLAGGGQDAREVALVGAGTDDQFDPLPLRLGDAPGTIEEWIPPGSEERHKGGGHFGPIHALAFSLDGALCISGAEDGNVRIRELADESVMQAASQTALQCADLMAAVQSAAEAQTAANRMAKTAAQPNMQPAAQLTAAQPISRQIARPPARMVAQPAAQPVAEAAMQPKARPAAQPAAQPSAHPASQPTVQSADTLVRAVAICDFDPSSTGWPPSAPQRPLPLRRGMEIEVVQDAGSGWTWGRPVGNPSALGLLPSNYILPLTTYQDTFHKEAASTRPAPRQQEVVEPEEEEGDCSQS